MVMQKGILVLGISASLLTVGCGHPPKAECIPGEYTLNKVPSVHLTLAGGRFKLEALGDTVVGRYEYATKLLSSDALSPAAGALTLYPDGGQITHETLTTMYRKSRGDPSITFFVKDMQPGSDVWYPVYDEGKALSIQLDADFFHSYSLWFEKAGCDSHGVRQRHGAQRE
jgi:hypothetical protein